jgi:hypothetical protein
MNRPRRRAARRPARSTGPARPRSRATPGGARARPTAGTPGCRRRRARRGHRARRAARAARSPARSAVTESAACSAGSDGSVDRWGGPQGRPPGLAAPEQQRAVRCLGGRGEAGGPQRLEDQVERRAAHQHGRCEPPQAQGLRPLGDEDLRQQRLVVAAQVGRRDADAHPAVAAGDVVDEVVRACGTGVRERVRNSSCRSRPCARRRAPGAPTPRRRGRRSRRRWTRRRRRAPARARARAPAAWCDDGEVGLDRGRGRAARAGRRRARRRRRGRRRRAARGRAGQPAPAGEAEPLCLAERPAVHQVAQPAAPARRRPDEQRSDARGRDGPSGGRRRERLEHAPALAGAPGRSTSGPSGASTLSRSSRSPTRPGRRVIVSQACARAVHRCSGGRAAQASKAGVGTHSGSSPGSGRRAPRRRRPPRAAPRAPRRCPPRRPARLSSRTPRHRPAAPRRGTRSRPRAAPPPS